MMLPKHQGPMVPANWSREPQPLLPATKHPEWVNSQDRSREKNYHVWRAGRVFDRCQKPWVQRSLKEHMSVDKLTTRNSPRAKDELASLSAALAEEVPLGRSQTASGRTLHGLMARKPKPQSSHHVLWAGSKQGPSQVPSGSTRP